MSIFKKEQPDNLWTKCDKCHQMIYRKDFEKNLKICPKCGFYAKMSAGERINSLVDTGTFTEMFTDFTPTDPLHFGKEYQEKLAKDQAVTGLKDAVVTGRGKINGNLVVIGAMDFSFRGGSMGSVVGEKVTLSIEQAAFEKLPLVIVCVSGGARMQEGMLSLMQMAKTSSALARFEKEKLLYISVLSDPTTAGVSASFAFLGDIIIAEPKALIGFTGPRVIEQTIGEKLPAGFQTAEFLLEKGMLDMVVARTELKNTLGRLLSCFNYSRYHYYKNKTEKIKENNDERTCARV